MTAERIRELESLEFKFERNPVSLSEQSVVLIQGALELLESQFT